MMSMIRLKSLLLLALFLGIISTNGSTNRLFCCDKKPHETILVHDDINDELLEANKTAEDIIKEQKNEIEQLKIKLDDPDRKYIEKQFEYRSEEQYVKIQHLNVKLDEKENALKGKQDEIDNWKDKSDNKSIKISEQENALNAKQEKIDAKNNQINDLENEIKAKQGEIDAVLRDKKMEIGTKDNKINRLENERDNKDAKIAEQQDALNAKQEEIDAKNNQINDLEESLYYNTDLIAQIKNELNNPDLPDGVKKALQDKSFIKMMEKSEYKDLITEVKKMLEKKTDSEEVQGKDMVKLIIIMTEKIKHDAKKQGITVGDVTEKFNTGFNRMRELSLATVGVSHVDVGNRLSNPNTTEKPNKK